jgi:hypothetical protein
MHNFVFALLAQCCLALVNSAALIASTTVAESYFPPNEIVLSTSFSSLSNFVGVGIGLIVPPYLADVELVLRVEAVFGVLCFLAYALLATKEPVTSHTISYSDLFTSGLRWRETSLLLLCGSAVGTSYTLIGLFQQLLSLNHYESIEAGWAGAVLVLGGITGGLIATLIAAKSHSLQLPLRLYIVLGTFASVLQCLALDQYVLYLFLDFLLGISLLGFVPLALRICVLSLYPLHESIATNLLFTFAQVFSLIYTYPILFFQSYTGRSGMWGIALCTIGSLVPLVCLCKGRKGDTGGGSGEETGSFLSNSPVNRLL